MMHTIPVITADQALFSEIRRIISGFNDDRREAVRLEWIGSFNDAADYLNVDMPELAILDFSNPQLDAFAILELIESDPWLHHGGIISLCSDREKIDRLEQQKVVNIIVNLMQSDLAKQLPRVIRIIDNNRRILFQREIGRDLLHNISGSFQLENDPVDAICYANLICNFLFTAGKISIANKNNLRLTLYELLVNAIEHGNCGITYDEKTDWLENHGHIGQLIEKKCQAPEISSRRANFEYSITNEGTSFVITDEGDGFDWRSVQAKRLENVILEQHGRGILMARESCNNLSYNEKGNQVRFEISYEQETEAFIPGIFSKAPAMEVKPGDAIFSEGEPSNFIYYIAKGSYDVIVGSNTISSLSEDDVFMGEMSFLLNNKRSASVRAATEGKLILLSKRAFITAIKKKPHYSLFLARLLAQRIMRANAAKT